MNLLDYGQNKQYMDDIKKNINNIVPFLGAGTSIPYGYPSWSELLLKVLNSIRNVTEMSESTYRKMKNVIKESHYMNATKEMYKHWPNLEDYVCRTISIIKKNSNSCLEKYIYLFPSKLFLTTNYDIIVEKILRLYLNLNVEIITSPTTSIGLKTGIESTRKEPTLYYLHGRYTDPNSIIFSEMDYNDFYGSSEVTNIKVINRRLLARKLQEVYARNPLLFIGCSMNIEEDRLLKLLQKFNQLGQPPQNYSYALLDADGLNTEQIDIKEEKLLSIRVHPIWYFSNEINHEQAKKELFEHILSEKHEEYEANIKKQKEEYEANIKKQKEKKEERRKLIKEIEEFSEIIEKFQYFQKYYSSNDNYEFTLIKLTKKNQYYLSDQGKTFIMLDKVFELKEPDVLKNLNAIANECEVEIIGNKLLVPLISLVNLHEDEKKQLLEEAKCRLFTCVSFMDKMKIFYV